MTREQRVGLFFAGGVLFFVAFIELTVGTGLLFRGYRVWAEFDDVQGLARGAQVRVSGVKVGTVDDVVLGGERVRVALDVREGVVLHEDGVVRLDFQALSGQRFVAIDPGTADAPAVADGATLRSEEPAGISQMVVEMQSLATSVRGLAESLNENQAVLLGNVNAMLEENRESFRTLLADVGGIAEKVNRGEGTLGRLLVDPALYDEAIAALGSLRESFGDIRQITGRLARGEGLLGKLLAEEDELYDDLRETLVSLNATARNFEDVSETVRLGHGTLGRMLVDDALYVEAEDALRGVTRATQGVEDQAPISVLGTLIGTLF